MSEIEGQFNENKENSPQRSETNQAELQVVNKNQDQENEKKENIPDNAQVEQNIQQEESPLIQNKIDRNNGTQNNFNQNQQQRSQADFRKSIYFQSSQRETNSAQSYFSRFQQRENLRKGCSEICCLPIGSHTFCCSSENTEKDFIQFGVGINLYFRFLKKIGCYFLIFTILSIPQLFFSVLSYVGSKARDSTNYYQFLMATTIGATSLNNQDCQIQYFDNLDVVVEFSLKCDSGNLAGSSFIYGIVNSNEQACIYLSQSELNLNTTNQDRLNQIRQDIDSQEEYSFNLLQSDFDKEDPKGKRIYAGARCKEAYITIGELEMQQKIVPVIFASCDAAIVILFIFFLLSLTSSEKKYNKISQKETPTLQHFSIQISSLPQSEQLIKALQVKENEQSKQILLLEVKKFIEYQLKSVLKQQDLQIYDIQVSEKQKILQLQQELKSQKEKIYEYLKEMENINFQQYQQAQTHFMDQAMSKDKYQRFYENLHQLCQDSNSEQKQKLNAINQNIQNCWMKMDEISGNIEQIQQVGDCKYIWVTFDTMRQKQQVQEKLQSLPKDWFYYYCCFCCFDESEKKDKFLLQKFKLQVKDAPIPENINWNNLNYSQKQRFLRQCVSLIATLILLAGSWVLISYVNLEKSDFQQKYPSINCNNKIYENITVEQVQLEIDGLSTIKGYVECYCKPKLTDIFQGDYDICSDWSKQYAFQQSLPWIIVGGLIGVNVLIQYVFIFLSSWEKHLMISEEYSSRILKIFLGQFLNTGLILLITNIDFGNSTRNDAPETIRFLFGGKYGDIDSKWCQNIGVVLLLTLLVNILTQPLTLSCEMLFRFMRKVYDQNSCCLNEKKTKAKNYQEFKDLYKGEQFRVELRYAQTLTALYICFMYSPALPFLFCITMLTIWFLFIVDKICIFKTYRKPVMIDSVISDSVRKYLWIAVLIHLGFATYIYGSSNLFYETIEASLVIEQLQDVYGQQNVVVEWWDRSWSQIPNIILLAILALLILIIFLFFFCYKPIVGLFSKCFACCNDQILKNKSLKLDQQESRQFMKFLKREQLADDLKFTQFQMMVAPSVYQGKYLKIQQELSIPIGNISNNIPVMTQDIQIDQLPLAQSQINQSNLIQQTQFQQNNPGNLNALAQSRFVPEQTLTKFNQQKLIGLRSYHKAYNKQYQKYYEWDEIKAINIE